MHCYLSVQRAKGGEYLQPKFLYFFFSSMGQACCALHYYYSFIFTSALVVSYMLHYFGASLTCVCVCMCRGVCVFFLSLSLLCTAYATCTNQGGCIWPRLSSLLAPVRLVFPSPKSNINKRSHRGFVVEQAEFHCSVSFLGVHFYCNFYCGWFPANPTVFFFHTTFPFAMRACLLLPPFTLCTVKYCTHFTWCVHIFLRIPQFRIILILVSCSYAARTWNCGTGAEMRFSLLYICFPAFCYFSCSRSPRLRSLQTRKCIFLQIFFFSWDFTISSPWCVVSFDLCRMLPAIIFCLFFYFVEHTFWEDRTIYL